jgi:hypothetical protein
MAEPATLAKRTERWTVARESGRDELRGYAVISLPFTSGHVLCLRCWPASSFGPGYQSVWHRAPEGAWTVYHSVAPELSCPRFVGAAISRAVQTPIDVEWTGPRRLQVRVEEAQLVWEMELGATPVTRTMNAVMWLLPAAFFRSNAVLSLMSAMSTVMFSAGHFAMRGTFPNHQWFQVAPRKVWMVVASAASFSQGDLGPTGPLAAQPTIGDVPLPQRGVFMVGGVDTDAYTPSRHLPAIG